MDDWRVDSPRSSDGAAALVGRGRVCLVLGIASLALVAMLTQTRTNETATNGLSPNVPSANVAGPNITSPSGTTENQPARGERGLRRATIPARHWSTTVAQFSGLVEGASLERIRGVADRLVQVLPQDLVPPPSFQVDLVDSPIEFEYAFDDGRLLVTSAMAAKLQTPGQVAALLSQMMERVIAGNDARYAQSPWAQLAVGLTAQAGFDPRALAWLLDQRTRAVASDLPNAEERIRLLRQQADRVTAEIATRYPQGVPDQLIK